jgi:hypothetical protein
LSSFGTKRQRAEKRIDRPRGAEKNESMVIGTLRASRDNVEEGGRGGETGGSKKREK